MSERDRLRRLLEGDAPIGAMALYEAGLDALDHGLFEQVAARAQAALAAGADGDYRLWQLLGLALRDLLDAGAAHAAFARAAALAPRDALIAHSLARTAHEAGLPAAAAYERALALDPNNAGILIGRAAARAAHGDGAGAQADLAATLAQHPGWHAGHLAFAGLAASAGAPPAATVERALTRFPDDADLWRTLIGIRLQAHDDIAALHAASDARARLGAAAEWDRVAASSLSELGEAAQAQALFDRLPRATQASDAASEIRTLIRLGRLEEAARRAETRFDPVQDRLLWPYRALLWRMLGDERWQWLEGDERLVGVYDLAAALGDIAELAETLRALHARSGTMLDQSVRGGTQTDGHLLMRAEPAIRRLHDVLRDAVATHAAQLPAAVAGHPTLVAHAPPYRFAGAWSVRLTGRGFHVDHVHPQGWLSSAFYIALPEGRAGEEGWLALGECRALLPELEAFRMVEPRVGRLVLFPSTMWHGTRPFREGERMTVAFDIARP